MKEKDKIDPEFNLKETLEQLKLAKQIQREISIVQTAHVKSKGDLKSTELMLSEKYGVEKAKFLLDQYISQMEE